ncbi:hypothetical protein NLI96_g8815 [Meripilus lineatus]|uniref:Uncharacterized protein n=1 Tax=Meripilus lineatus TaxID=2056292 RepID=A0AAD5UY92_9APHY|nr:hypothetical protein NLI96_g8815 [Physisporinus lineatus]
MGAPFTIIIFRCTPAFEFLIALDLLLSSPPLLPSLVHFTSFYIDSIDWYRRGGGGIPKDQGVEGHRYDRGGRTRMGDAGHPVEPRHFKVKVWDGGWSVKRVRRVSHIGSLQLTPIPSDVTTSCDEEDDEEQDERDEVGWSGDTLSFPLRDPREGKND